MEDGCVHVKLHDLSMDITDEQVTAYLTQYGEVFSVQELLWTDDYEFAGLPTGIRLVKMLLQQPIKSFVSICGENTYVTYSGQRATCKHCGEYIHTGIPCVQNKKLLVQKASVNERLNASGGTSYAGVLKQKPAAPKDTNNLFTDVYEISDSEGTTTKTNGSTVAILKPPENPTVVVQTEQMDTTVEGLEIQATNPLNLSTEISMESNTAHTTFKPPILPCSTMSNSTSKHKRDDGNTTDDSAASARIEDKVRDITRFSETPTQDLIRINGYI